MTESSQVCGRAVNSWTKFIGWMEIVGSVISIIIVIIGSIVLIVLGPAKHQEIIENSDDPDLALFKLYGFGFMVAVLVTGFVVSLVNGFMGIILLKGANERNVRYVNAYLIYLIISLCYTFTTKFILFNMTIVVPASTAHQEIIEVLPHLSFVIFGFWVVWKFKKELEMDSTGGKGVVYKS